jgi:hypothetical protein
MVDLYKPNQTNITSYHITSHINNSSENITTSLHHSITLLLTVQWRTRKRELTILPARNHQKYWRIWHLSNININENILRHILTASLTHCTTLTVLHSLIHLLHYIHFTTHTNSLTLSHTHTRHTLTHTLHASLTSPLSHSLTHSLTHQLCRGWVPCEWGYCHCHCHCPPPSPSPSSLLQAGGHRPTAPLRNPH